MNNHSCTQIKPCLARVLMIAALAITWGSWNAAVAAERGTPKSNSSSGGPCVMATDQAVADLFRSWNLALASKDSTKVAALYWSNAVLLPTVSNIPRTDTALITEYFDHFLQKSPRGTIVRRMTQHYCGVSVDAGLYEFSVMDSAGNVSTVAARYTFVYSYRDGAWKIQHHHSSAMPEPVAKTPEASPAAHTDAHTDAYAETHAAARVETPAKAPTEAPSEAGSAAMLRIELESASRTPSSKLTAEQRRKVGRETVGLKVCAASQESDRSFEVSDPAPYPEVNEAAVAWAKDATWSVSGAPTAETPACTQIVVRFAGAGL
ncbi:MAG: SgcJ/EcaC family oxidoreductase [Gammaproteobacteria bacterium]|nr:SgcJ/EcaC family oxidoreductase [Gammaproteobacteria bacterium]